MSPNSHQFVLCQLLLLLENGPSFIWMLKMPLFNSDLEEDVYMQPPLGYPHPSNTAYRLHQAFYGFKQASHAWFAKFSSTITQFGFIVSTHNSIHFTCKTSSGFILLLFYVNNMIIIRDNTEGIYDMNYYLSQQYEMKDLGFLNYFLDLEVSASEMDLISHM